MKRLILATGLFAAFLFGDWQAAIDPSSTGGSFVRPAAAYNDDAYRDFDQSMRPYGQWVVTPQWGHVWIPAGMPRGWRPYSDGHWDYTDDYGWVWVSDQEWGWAAFHYGRWAFDGQFGWVWVPGRVWGPAWVSFRYGDAYVGWAPLPPEGYDEVPYYGYEPTINVSFWNFVPRQHFNDRYVNRYYNYHNNVNFYHNTTNVTNITVINNRVVNNSINVNNFERDTRQRVVRHRVDVTDTVVPVNQRSRGNDLVVVRPKDVERNAGNPRIQSQQTGNQNGRNHGNGNQPGPGPAIVTNRDHGKPNGQNQQGPTETVILPPTGKPDNSRGTTAGPNNWQGGTAQNLKHNGNPNGNANVDNGHGKPAPVIIPPPDNAKHYQGQPQNLGSNNGNTGHGQAGNNEWNRQQQEAQQQMLRKNNGQGQPPPAGNNPPAHAPKKAPANDCVPGSNKGCSKP